MSSRDLASSALREMVHFRDLLTARTFVPTCVWDIGANVGLYSLAISSVYPGVKVHAFEPVRTNVSEMLTNIADNSQWANITPHSFGISECDCTVKMGIPAHRESENTGLYSMFYNQSGMGKDITDECRMRTAVSALQECRDAPDMVKIDVEGAEMHVLRSLMSLGDIVRAVIVEVAEDPQFCSPHVVTQHLLEQRFSPAHPHLDFVALPGKRGKKAFNRLWVR